MQKMVTKEFGGRYKFTLLPRTEEGRPVLHERDWPTKEEFIKLYESLTRRIDLCRAELAAEEKRYEEMNVSDTEDSADDHDSYCYHHHWSFQDSDPKKHKAMTQAIALLIRDRENLIKEYKKSNYYVPVPDIIY